MKGVDLRVKFCRHLSPPPLQFEPVVIVWSWRRQLTGTEGGLWTTTNSSSRWTMLTASPNTGLSCLRSRFTHIHIIIKNRLINHLHPQARQTTQIFFLFFRKKKKKTTLVQKYISALCDDLLSFPPNVKEGNNKIFTKSNWKYVFLFCFTVSLDENRWCYTWM